MNKLKDILDDATATAYCAGQDWSKSNPTTDKVDEAADQAEQAIIDLFLGLVGEKDLWEGRTPGSSMKNKYIDELRTKIKALAEKEAKDV